MTTLPAAIAILQTHSLTMLVQRELERMVLAGEFAAGEKLDEAEIAQRLGVSRGPVREALRAVAETGLVRAERNRGVFVRKISSEEADEIFEVRAALDRLAGRKLAATIRPEQLAELRGVVATMRASARREDREGYHAANLRFHDALVEFSANAKLLQTYRRLVNELSLFRRHSLEEPRRLPRSFEEHERILGYIAAGQVDAAGEALHEHAMASRALVHELAAPAADTPASGATASGTPARASGALAANAPAPAAQASHAHASSAHASSAHASSAPANGARAKRTPAAAPRRAARRSGAA